MSMELPREDFDFAALAVEDSPQRVPDHKASKDEDYVPTETDSSPKSSSQRPGIFGQRKEPRQGYQRKTRTRKAPPPNVPGQFVESLVGLYGTIGLAVAPFSPEVGRTILQQAEPCAEALDKAAQENESLRRVLKAVTATSVWGAVIMAHAPIVGAIIVNHTSLLPSDSDSNFDEALRGFMGPQQADK